MKKIIGLVGETGSGKDFFCRHLENNYNNIFVFAFSQPLTEALKIFFDKIKKEDQQWLIVCLRNRFGNNILGEAIKKKIKKIKEGIIVLNGVRVFEEAEMIKKLGGKIIYINAESIKRWKRVKKRHEKKDDDSTYDKFLELEKASPEKLISKIGQQADFEIENNGSKQEFCRKIEEIINKIRS
jgi:dephospho-CoA kinase